MSTPKSRLGRGLGALIASGTSPAAKKPDTPAATPAASSATAPAAPAAGKPAAATTAPAAPAAAPAGFAEIAVASVEPNPHQPRKSIEPTALQELADSIRAEGLLQPIVVRKVGEKFQLIAGERRWRAFQKLQIKTIPARVIAASDASSASLALIENLQREGLNPMEESYGYASLMRDFDLTQEAVSERVGKGRATVANSLRLLNLDGELQGFLAKAMLSVGHAKVLLGIEKAAERSILARRVIEEGLSVRALEQLVQRHKNNASPAPSAPGSGRPVPAAEATAVANVEKKLTSYFNARVALKHSPKRGKIVIEYQGNNDLQRILDKLGVSV